ncbi:hypothetical protein CORC01_06594 [Colletotrichum orchidophilum]|uniref:Uncharacterized protein n=1 Tax=Colletotrichum orchidophilum TaxID=1209926 RepID=A0A1G4B9J1_9PEZI|nr:uncharacterized protein CORC01_06594 [Colletotrichum orchidophilum]OHE98080.1 hypothetical protein CORC01_06594 [Colletotrichum orchidophilum]
MPLHLRSCGSSYAIHETSALRSKAVVSMPSHSITIPKHTMGIAM